MTSLTAEDRTAIAALVYGYAEAVDAGDFAAAAALFEHASFRGVAGRTVHTRQGSAEVQAQFEQLVKLQDDGTPGTKHVTTNLVIAPSGDAGTATCSSYFTVLQAAPGPSIEVIVAGRYEDTFERDASGHWRFAERLIRSDQVGDVSRHLRGSPLG